tara:strand:- start:1030 stop:1956 length:927 start_codon:yes stop_codon:yes gene_type:complete
MHKCINNSIGNVYHLEQFVDEFFPYSQKQLGFDKPVTVRFESDPDNAATLLGKTAYYDPDNYEVVLYVDNRHPKDVMRSLSHELVHHAQNCRGDFTSQNSTGPGYAQKDPHLRKMEQEAYTKGNLIFRDFEDLIKTGKINIEIDFSDSGEPKMSLKEWKNAELNRNLMKKWGFLNESIHEGGGAMYRDEDDYKGIGSKEHDDEEGNRPSMAKDMDLKEDSGEDEAWHDWMNEHADDDHIREIRHHLRALEEDRDHDRHDAEYDHDDYEDDRKDESVTRVSTSTSGKISVKEAKEITRRIIARVKKEGR